MRLSLLTLVALAGASPAHAEVIEVVRAAPVHPRPGASPERGTVAEGARFTVTAHKQGSGCKLDWLEIGPKAWICARATQPSDQPALAAALPVVPAGQLLPGSTYVLAHHPHLYATLEAIDAGQSSRFWGKHAFELLGTVTRGGVEYVQVHLGYIARSETEIAAPSKVGGVVIDATVKLPFVFAHKHEGAQLLDADHAPVAGETVARWARLELLGEVKVKKARWYRVRRAGSEVERLVSADDVRKVVLTTPPKAVKAGDKWIDVDLAQQVMVAYVGTTPLRATLVLTAKGSTPAGTFHIERKRAYTALRSREGAIGKYFMEVPWVMSVVGSIAIHTAYWHDDFGTPNSHGCVNLTPADARWVWDWSDPPLPPGWDSIIASGTLVHMHR